MGRKTGLDMVCRTGTRVGLLVVVTLLVVTLHRFFNQSEGGFDLAPPGRAAKLPCRVVDIAVVVGARPQYMKAAPVLREAAARGIRTILIDTGQHFDHVMSSIFYQELEIEKPAYVLGIGSATQAQQVGRALEKIEDILRNVSVSAVLVFGDTNAAPAGALAAVKLGIPVVHVESGLRSGDFSQPEEINRVVTDHVSSLLFVPSHQSAANLRREGIHDGVVVSGDVHKDTFLRALDTVQRQHIMQSLSWVLSPHVSQLELKRLLDQSREGVVYATIHRPINTNSKYTASAWITALAKLEALVVIAAHPRLTQVLGGSTEHLGKVVIIPPLSYMRSVALIRLASFVVTDSGGLQREAYWARKRIFTLRGRTEWVETLQGRINSLASTPAELEAAFLTPVLWQYWRHDLYGDGKAACRIIEHIIHRVRDVRCRQ